MRTQATEENPTPGPRFRARLAREAPSAGQAKLSNDADAALGAGRMREGLAMLRRLWRATADPWHLTRMGAALFRAKRLRRARIVLERAARFEPFHVLAGSLLIHVARAQGDRRGERRAWERALARHGAALPPEPW